MFVPHSLSLGHYTLFIVNFRNLLTSFSIQWGFKPRLNKVKASGGCHRFSRKFIEQSWIKPGRKYAKAHLIDLSAFVSCSTVSIAVESIAGIDLNKNKRNIKSPN